MQVRKAVLTAAGRNQRTLPLQSLVAPDGRTKPALLILVEEVLAAGIEEVAVVVSPGDEGAFRTAAGSLAGRLEFAVQEQSLGYGHAVWCAREFTGQDAFLLLVGDHLYVSRTDRNCCQQLVDIAAAEKCAVSAVQATHESKLPYYGAVGGHLAAGRQGLYEISTVLEKPTPTEAEQTLIVPGLRAGHYLCFFGMHVLTPGAMKLLGEAVATASPEVRVQLSTALARLSSHERYLAAELAGRRYDLGLRYGLWTAQLAIALAGQDRDEVLTSMVETLAQAQK